MKYIKSSGFSTVHLSVTASHRIQSRSEDLGTFKRRFPGGCWNQWYALSKNIQHKK